MMRAHRFAFEMARGPVPEGLQLDHLCRVRHCVNPGHLELVTSRVNTLRGTSFSAVNATKTHCPKGHPYSTENTHTDASNKRHCRVCNREAAR